MDAISNQYDGPIPPAKRLPTGKFNLDYANSDNAAETDAGIRDTIKGVRLSILAMGLGLAKLKAKGLFIDPGYHSMNDYLERLSDEMQIDRTTVFIWLHIGESYVKYRRELEKIEFTDADGPTKLYFVDRALEIHEKKRFSRKSKRLHFGSSKNSPKVKSLRRSRQK